MEYAAVTAILLCCVGSALALKNKRDKEKQEQENKD